MAPAIPSYVATEDVLRGSVRVLAVQHRELWSRWRGYASDHGARPLVELVEQLLELGPLPDTARVRHWCHVTVAILRSYHQGLDPAPGFVSHFQLDSLHPDRLTELHTFRLVAALIAGRLDATDGPSLNADVIGGPALPLELDLGCAGMLEPAPADVARPWRLELEAGRLLLAPLDALDDLVDAPAVTGVRVQRAARWRHSAPIWLSHPSGGRLSAPVHDRGLREPYSATAPVVWSAPAVTQWLETLRTALDRCFALDETLFRECLRLTPEVLPLYHGIGQQYGSASNIDVPGYTYLPGIERPLDVAECLVHEAMHQKLFRIESLVPLFAPESPAGETFYSPWRVDPRPLRMVLHGCYVFAYVAWMWRAWSDRPPPEAPDREASAELAYRRACEVLAGVGLLEQFARLTPRGRTLLDEITRCASEVKQAAQVSSDHGRRVSEAISAHRERHLKTSQCSDPITF